MSDIFLSYAREDQAIVKSVAECLANGGYDIFWDRSILHGHHFAEVIERNLENAQCVIVFWSKYSTRSRWVKAEAGWGDERKALVEVQLDTTKPPLPFGRTQIVPMHRWSGRRSAVPFVKLEEAIRRKQSPDSAIDVLDPPHRGVPVSADHLVIIHTSERRPEYDHKYDRDMYIFEVIVYGHHRTLDQIEKVTWYLHPSYGDQSVVTRDRRSRRNCFRLRQLAWGESVIQARVKVAGQVELILLSRYLNLTGKGDPLKGFYY